MNTAFFLKTIWLICLTATACNISNKSITSTADTPVVTIVQSDKLGNYFAVDKQGVLKKFDINGKVSFNYTSQRSGKLTSFDATDPMKILVFFRESQEIVMLDNTLSEISRIPLNQMQGRYFSSIARTMDGLIALFDANTEILLKTNDNLEIEAESFPLFQEGFAGFKPQQLKSNARNIVLNDLKRGFILMDNFCNFRKFIAMKDAVLIQVNDDELIYLRDDKLVRMDMTFYEEQTIPWPQIQTVPAFFGYEHRQVIIFDKLN